MNQKSQDLLTTLSTALVLLTIVTSIVTLVYWVAGGVFERGTSLAIYAMILVYVWTLVVKIAIEKHGERTRLKTEVKSCRVCGTHPNSPHVHLKD